MVSVGWGVRTITRTHLVIAGFDPLLVKAMPPKVTLAVIRCVWFPAVGAPGDVGAWGALGGGGNRRGSLRVTFAAARKDTMVVLTVGAQAYRTPELGGATRRRGMTPPPASRAQRGARISPGRPKVRGVLSKLDSLPDEPLGPGPRHRVRDVEVDSAGVGLGRVFFFFFFLNQQFITRCSIAVRGKPYKLSTAYGYISVRLKGRLPP
jgi:hypothetical protein